jgi:peptidoglycan/LPS O-acetylase OafA/YrhL
VTASLSIYLDLLRFSAATLVFLAHASHTNLTHGTVPEIGKLADDAVMAFFVLSGFVIAYTAETKERTADEFVKARLARLWSVALPALLVTVVADQIGRSIDVSIYDPYWYRDSWPVLRLLADALFLNEIWFVSILPFSNAPYWSIGYEFWYYMLFAATFFLTGRTRWLAVSGICLLIGPKILILLPVWWLGVFTYHQTKLPMNRWLALGLFVMSIAGYAAFLVMDGRTLMGFDFWELWYSTRFPSKYVVGMLIGVSILGFAKMPAVPFGPLVKPIRWLAGMTFSLYLFHYPLLHFYAAFGLPPYAMIALTLITVAALAQVTERRKHNARRLVDAAWPAHLHRPVLATDGRQTSPGGS